MISKSPILLSRTDRLGDVLMTLPAVVQLRNSLPPGERLIFQCRPEYVPVVAPYLKTIGIETTSKTDLKSLPKFGAVLFFHFDKGLATEAWKRGVPLRVGIFSKPSSFLLLNFGMRQKRSRAEKNEAQYNLELAKFFIEVLGAEVSTVLPPPIELPPGDLPVRDAALRQLAEIGVNADEPFVVVHPGMGGSALNAAASHYASLIEQLKVLRGKEVVLSIGPGEIDRVMLDAIGNRAKRISGVSLNVLMEIFRRAAWVVAPSTGPLHLAHYVGTSTVGIFPPVRSHRPLRWAPWGGTGQSRVLVPRDPCPGKKDCIGRACPYYFCMDRVAWAQLAEREIRTEK